MESLLLALFKMLPFRFAISLVLTTSLRSVLHYCSLNSSLVLDILSSLSHGVVLYSRLWYLSPVTELVDEFTLITHLVFLLILVHHGNVTKSLILSLVSNWVLLLTQQHRFVCRLHGVCKENPLAPVIGRLGLPLYRTSGDNSVLYDHDLERCVQQLWIFRLLCCLDPLDT